MMNELASGPTLPPMFDAVRDQAGSRKMQGAGPRVERSGDS